MGINRRALHYIGVAVTLLSVASLAVPTGARAQSSLPSRPSTSGAPWTSEPVAAGVSRIDLRSAPRSLAPRSTVVPEGLLPAGPPVALNPAETPATAPRGVQARAAGADAFSDTAPNVGGQNGATPPDPTGAVGPNHYIQMVNVTFSIFSKAGALLTGPTNTNVLWQNAGQTGRCATNNDGDPIVVYDQLADRWLVSQFATDGTGDSECIAISQTPDPVAGGWFVYDFATPDFPDYPKFGVWPTGYFMTSFEGANLGLFAFDRTAMLTGAPATFQRFTLDSLAGGRNTRLLPSHLDGTSLPPAGSPNYFYRPVDGAIHGGADRLEIYEFAVNFANPALTTCGVGGVGSVCGAPNTTLAPNAFDISLCYTTPFPFRDCIPQPGTTQRIDSLSGRPMMQLQYRNFGTYEAMVVNNTVLIPDATPDHAGIRWYELRRVGGGAWTIFQQGDHAPDAAHRWMGSIAMDNQGNIALAYTVSSGTVFPSLRYAGRLVTDPLGTLPRGDATPTGEATIVNGTTAQTTANRWGDYSHMTVDPVDDCTFWFTGQFNGNRATQIAAFGFPTCTPPTPCAAPPPPPPGAIMAVAGSVTVGTPGNDVIYGTAGPDRIFGMGGNDLIFGRGGDDQLAGGDGDDIICGGDGNDMISGGNGNDILSGDGGVDDISGGAGDDILLAVVGTTNRLAGGTGSDTCIGDGSTLYAQCEVTP